MNIISQFFSSLGLTGWLQRAESAYVSCKISIICCQFVTADDAALPRRGMKVLHATAAQSFHPTRAHHAVSHPFRPKVMQRAHPARKGIKHSSSSDAFVVLTERKCVSVCASMRFWVSWREFSKHTSWMLRSNETLRQMEKNWMLICPTSVEHSREQFPLHQICCWDLFQVLSCRFTFWRVFQTFDLLEEAVRVAQDNQSQQTN